MKKFILLIILAVVLNISEGQNSPKCTGADVSSKNQAPLSFIENRGEVTDQYRHARPDILFSVKATQGLNIFIGKGIIHYQFNKTNSTGLVAQNKNTTDSLSTISGNHRKYAASTTYAMSRVDVELVGANSKAELLPDGKLDYYENYFTENTGEHGATVFAYNRISYKNIYPNIDWVLYMKNGQLEYEFVIHEGGKASDIKLKYEGTTDLRINDVDGSLTATTRQGTITEQAPKSYQPDGRPVNSNFKLNGNILTYETGFYENDLVIDPALIWATYYGGSAFDAGGGLTTDKFGNVFIAGTTSSISGIATSGAYDDTLNGSMQDAYLAKFNSAGQRLWATYYGGSSDNSGEAAMADDSGNVYITGYTLSSSGIATPGSFQDTITVPISASVFLVKFNSSGIRLWGTYYGTSGSGDAIATDKSGNVYLLGGTSSGGMATGGAYQTSCIGYDAFLVKFTSAGARLWATYFGYGATTDGYGVATDSSGNVYITGCTQSSSGIATSGAFQSSPGGGNDAYLAKFNSVGVIQWATYYGGSGADNSYGVSTDKSGNVYMTGYTSSTTGIATPGAYQTNYGGGNFDAFLAKFDGTGARLWATYYGGNSIDWATAVATDDSGNVFLTGYTYSPNGIATTGAYQTSIGGGEDAFLAQFNAVGSMPWATYYGGTNTDNGGVVAMDGSGNVYFTGGTKSSSGIATPGAFQTSYGGNGDNFLAKFAICPLPSAGTITGPSSTCVGSIITLVDSVSTGVWFSSDTFISKISSVGILTGIDVGHDTIIYGVTNACGSSQATLSFNVKSATSDSVTATAAQPAFCPGDSSQVCATQGYATYIWNTGDTGNCIYSSQAGRFWVSVTDNNGCTATSNLISLMSYPLDSATITGHGDTLTSNPAVSYQWYHNNQAMAGETGRTIIATQSGNYAVEITDSNGCHYMSSTTQITAINEVIAPYGVKLYPNPNSGTFILEFTDDIVRDVEITDAIGRTVMASVKVSRQQNFNLEELSAGVYIVRINQQGQVQSLKFTLVR